MGDWENAVNAEFIENLKNEIEELKNDLVAVPSPAEIREYYKDIGIKVTEKLYEHDGEDYQI